MKGNKLIGLLAATVFIVACQSSTGVLISSTATILILDSTETVILASATPLPTQSGNPEPKEIIVYPSEGQLISRINGLEDQLVALTIDDGYGKIPFDIILKELRDRDIQATFFLVGLAAINLGPERMDQLVEGGHHIAYHSFAHVDLDQLRNWDENDWLLDVEKWMGTMRELIGPSNFELAYRPFARAPYGLFNLSFLAMAKELELVPVGWSNDPGDLLRGIKLQAGDIFLLHVRYPDAELIGPILDEQDFEFVPLEELFAAQSNP